MASALLALLIAVSAQQGDTATFRDAETAGLYARARVRHVRQDSLVRDYQATVHTRMEASAGRSRFARRTTLIAHESVAEVTWSRPNDLRVRVTGARAIAPIVRMLSGLGGEAHQETEEDLRGDMVMDRPWFIPRALGDSIRVMGVPEHAALHPLADGAVDMYRFAITDSVTLIVPGRTVRAVEMVVEPRERGPSLVAGRMWLDAETADVVRFRMVFVGDYVWDKPDGATAEDSATARKESATVTRFVSVEAEVEYALIDRQYWMPSRQFLALTAELPWFVNLSIPARVVTTFSDYTVNTGATVAFTISEEELDARDAERAASDDERVVTVSAGPGGVAVRVDDEHEVRGEDRRERGYYRAARWRDGRWEMEVPPADSLARYEWEWELTPRLDAQEEAHVRETFAALAALQEDLPTALTGRSRGGVAWESVADIVRFNRVQGPSGGIGYRYRTPVQFTSLFMQGRIGLADLRPTASVVLRRDGPGGRFDAVLYREVREVESWTGGLGIANSLNAVLAGHDDADYYLGLGAALAYGWNHGLLENVALSAAFERHDSMAVAIDAPLPELWGPGDFQVNPPVSEAWYVRGGIHRRGGIGLVGSEQGVDILSGGGSAAGRVWGSVRIPFAFGAQSGALSLRAGGMRGDSLPQMYFRLGGPKTIRGYDYGTRWGREFWSAQLDVAPGQGAGLAPVAFVDVGDTFASDPMVGAGVGLSLLNGLVRFNLAKGLRPRGGLRFDLLFRAPR